MNALFTDAYKLSMAEAGWPLRDETFYYSHRKGGWQLVPCDIEAWIRAQLPVLSEDDELWLRRSGYQLGAATCAAYRMHDALRVRALPAGAWFHEREPICTVSGPSALVSWLEPLLLRFNYRIQVATAARIEPERLAERLGPLCTDEQAGIVRETLDQVGVSAPPLVVDPEGYRARVRAAAEELVQITGDPARVFEVGMRSATCESQHRVALEALAEAGIRATSNVGLARELGLRPIGTMGHEHVQRYGSDEAAFRAMRERRPGPSSFLLDTFHTLSSGLPTAFALIEEEPARGDSIRYDSGDKLAQYRHAVAEARRRGIEPTHILEDAFDAALTRDFEALREELGVPAQKQLYGYGGHLVARPTGSELTRDRVSAVYKLTRSGRRANMKFGDERGLGKESLPGEPLLCRRVRGEGPTGMVVQPDEPPPADMVLLTGAAGPLQAEPPAGPARLVLSPATAALRARLEAEAEAAARPFG